MAGEQFEHYRGQLVEKERELQAALTRIGAERSEETPDGSPDVGDRANRSNNKDSILQELDRDRAVLALVEEALRRGEEGTYGICINCGRPVEPKRLEAVPWTRYCIACQERIDAELR